MFLPDPVDVPGEVIEYVRHPGPLHPCPAESQVFGPKRGSTWLNMLNDQAAGLNAMVVSGTPRDSLNTVDVVLRQPAGSKVPDDIITDTGSYSDIVFGLLHLLGRKHRPQLANLPDQRLWRVDPTADYGPLDKAARDGSTGTGSASTGKTCVGSRCACTAVRCPPMRSRA